MKKYIIPFLLIFLTNCTTAEKNPVEPAEIPERNPTVMATETAGTPKQTSTVRPIPTLVNPSPTISTPADNSVSVTFMTDDGVQLYGTQFGEGNVAVILAHQGTVGADQTGWYTFGKVLAEHGFTALTFDFRGKGQSRGNFSYRTLDRDVRAAFHYLQDQGFDKILCVGASMGGTACMRTALDGYDFKAIGILASGPVAGVGSNALSIAIEEFANMNIPKLFITADRDFTSVVRDTRRMYDASPYPKEIHILPGRVHGTDLFQTEAADDLTSILLRFLEAPGDLLYQDSILKAELKGSSGPIYSLAWSPDAKWLASAGYKQIKVWDSTTMLEHKTLDDPDSYIWGVAWSPNGDHLAGASQDGSVHLWETDTFKKVGDLKSGWAFSLAWSPNSLRLAVGTRSGATQIWNLETMEMEMQLDGNSPVISLAWTPNREILALGLLNGEIRIWQLETGELENTLIGSLLARSDTNGLAWLADGTLLASAHQDQNVRIWDMETGKQAAISPLAGHHGWIRAVGWSQDGNCLVSGGEDTMLRIWDTRQGKMLTSLMAGTHPIWAAAWSPDGHFLATADGIYNSHSEGGVIRVWSITGCGSK